MTTQKTRPRRHALLHALLTAGVMSGHLAILPINGNELLKRPVAKIEAPAVQPGSPTRCPKATNRSTITQNKPAQKNGWSNLARRFL